jgi:hypothetical protein
MKLAGICNKIVVEKDYIGIKCTIHRKKGKLKVYNLNNREIELDEFLRLRVLAVCDSDFVLFGSISGEGYDQKMHISDVYYYDNTDISDLPWYKRKTILRTFNFCIDVKEVYSLVVITPEELTSAINLFSLLPGSRGAIVREYSSPANRWFAFSSKKIINLNLAERNRLVTSDDIIINVDMAPEFKSLVLPGETIELEIDGVCKHEWRNSGSVIRVAVSLINPRVISKNKHKCNSMEEILSLVSNIVIEDASFSYENQPPDIDGGVINKFSEEFWNESWDKMYPSTGIGEVIIDIHSGIKVPHIDIRFMSDYDMWGFTVLSDDVMALDGAQAFPKYRMPPSWIDNNYANSANIKRVISQEYSCGVWYDGFIEILFLNGPLKGRCVFTRESQGWKLSLPESQNPLSQEESLKSKLKERYGKLYWRNPFTNEAPELIE